MPAHEKTISTAEAARHFGVSTRTLLRWIEAGQISVVTLPSGRHRVPLAEIDRILTPIPMREQVSA